MDKPCFNLQPRKVQNTYIRGDQKQGKNFKETNIYLLYKAKTYLSQPFFEPFFYMYNQSINQFKK